MFEPAHASMHVSTFTVHIEPFKVSRYTVYVLCTQIRIAKPDAFWLFSRHVVVNWVL